MRNCRWLFWHRKDLRIEDNIGLNDARSKTNNLIGVYILDPVVLSYRANLPPISSSQAWFLEKSLLELQANWKSLGSELILLSGNPLILIPLLAEEFRAEMVSWNQDIEPYRREQDKKIYKKLQLIGCNISLKWDQLIINPQELETLSGNPYKVFTPFFNRWIKETNKKSFSNNYLTNNKPSKEILGIKIGSKFKAKHPELIRAYGQTIEVLNSLHRKDNSFSKEICPCKPGEAAGKLQLEEFCNQGIIFNYSENRDIPSKLKTSKISAGLTFGTISPRQAWIASENVIALAANKTQLDSIYTWKKELAWREFYQHALFHFPELANGSFRKIWRYFPWENNQNSFNCWCESQTGIPIIDAAMRELNQSGWMHNRCRMIVASFLVKDLICDWRLGESFFMEKLIDGDLASNNGGWQWSASSGMDPKPLRIFNPYLQAKKFDPNADYIRRWLPEIAHISTTDLLSGEIIPLERKGYPSPIVIHKFQQAKFKELYSRIKP